MAHEARPWKKEGCVVSVAIDSLTKREEHSREINESHGEGGGLNANYRTVEAIARAASILGENSFTYGVDFVWKTGSGDHISFDFVDEETREVAIRCLKNRHIEILP